MVGWIVTITKPKIKAVLYMQNKAHEKNKMERNTKITSFGRLGEDKL